MNMARVGWIGWGCCAIALLVAAAAQAGDEAGLRIGSFNIRFGSASDGEDRWEVRRARVVRTMEDLNLDVWGLQEAETFQVRELLAALPRYAAIGAGREDGRLKGEACPILVDRARFAIVESGVFWLSDRPFEPGSITWDNACTRLCTWARLIDWRSGRGCTVYNVHLDHVGQDSRLRAATQIRAHFAALAERTGGGDPLLVVGDFNAAEDNPAIETLRGATGDKLTLRDTYRVLHADGAAGTFTGFDVKSDGGDRKIDYVWIGPGWKVRQAEIDRRKIDGRHPSDHFAVWAEVGWGE